MNAKDRFYENRICKKKSGRNKQFYVKHKISKICGWTIKTWGFIKIRFRRKVMTAKSILVDFGLLNWQTRKMGKFFSVTLHLSTSTHDLQPKSPN